MRISSVKISLKVTFLILSSVALFYCKKPPVYPETPYIEFESVTSTAVTLNSINYDSLTLRISFRDGDGDIGLTEADTNDIYQFRGDPIYDTVKVDSIVGYTINPNYYNYHATMFIKENGQYKEYPLPDPSLNYNGRIGKLTTADKAGPIEGHIDYGIKLRQKGPQSKLDTLRFEIYLIDRKLNKSNKVLTDEIITNI